MLHVLVSYLETLWIWTLYNRGTKEKKTQQKTMQKIQQQHNTLFIFSLSSHNCFYARKLSFCENNLINSTVQFKHINIPFSYGTNILSFLYNPFYLNSFVTFKYMDRLKIKPTKQ